jgi:cell wall-associated NlpC family hydrolase
MSRSIASRRSVGALAFVVVALVPTVLASTVLAPTMAGAEPTQTVGDLQAKAKQVAAEMDRLELKANQLDEDFNQSQIEIADLQTKITANQSEVDLAQNSLVRNQGQAKQYAIDAYTSGGPVDPVLMAGRDTADASHRKIYLSQLQGNTQQVLADISSAQQNLADRSTALATLKERADKKSKQLASTKSSLEETIAAGQRLTDSVNGELAAAVSAEQTRIEAQRQADAERAAQLDRENALAAAERARVAASAAAGDGSESDLAQAGDGSSGDSGGLTFPDPGPVRPGIQTVLDAAQSQLGVPYVWGASSPGRGFDCSGLILWAYNQIGVSLPHSSRAMRAMTQRISFDQAQPGDLVFYGSPVHHVGLYIGSGQMVHAPHSGDVVKVSGVYSSGSPSFGRI